MPYIIRKLPKKDLYKVYNKETKKVHSYATTLENAKKQVNLLLRKVEQNTKGIEGEGLKPFFNRVGSKVSLIDEIISMINGISICQSYLNDFHRKQNLRYIIIKQKNIEFYIFITYLFKQQIINMGFLDKYISVSIIINEYAINCALSRLKYFQEIYGIKQTDYMYYKIKDIL